MNKHDAPTPCTSEIATCVRDLSRQAEPFAAVYHLQHHQGHCALSQVPKLLKAHIVADGRTPWLGNLHVTTAVALGAEFGSPAAHLMRTQLDAAGRAGAALEAVLLAVDVAGIAEAHAARGSCFTCPRFASRCASRASHAADT